MDYFDINKEENAQRFLAEAYEKQMAGQIDEAIVLYLKSIESSPSAEAHQYLGWAYSLKGRFGDAIRECEKAIRIDPQYGNPYNDIGAYLIETGRWSEALPWLEKQRRRSVTKDAFTPGTILVECLNMRETG